MHWGYCGDNDYSHCPRTEPVGGVLPFLAPRDESPGYRGDHSHNGRRPPSFTPPESSPCHRTEGAEGASSQAEEKSIKCFLKN